METNVQTYTSYYESPIGYIKLVTTDRALVYLAFDENPSDYAQSSYPEIMSAAIRELEMYFSGELKEFSVKIKQSATPFCGKVYDELLKIPYGKTLSYKELAERCGNKRALRAVGGACGRNRIMIIVPCHRIISANGSLTGFAGGIERKKYLLEHEQKHSGNC